MKLDFKSNSALDLQIQNGDFVIGDCVATQASVLINATFGDLRQFPDAGVGLPLQLGFTSDPQYLSSLIISKLAEDGIIATNVEVIDDRGSLNVKMDLQ